MRREQPASRQFKALLAPVLRGTGQWQFLGAQQTEDVAVCGSSQSAPELDGADLSCGITAQGFKLTLGKFGVHDLFYVTTAASSTKLGNGCW
jgi:hypothetical protein